MVLKPKPRSSFAMRSPFRRLSSLNPASLPKAVWLLRGIEDDVSSRTIRLKHRARSPRKIPDRPHHCFETLIPCLSLSLDTYLETPLRDKKSYVPDFSVVANCYWSHPTYLLSVQQVTTAVTIFTTVTKEYIK